ncbi:MAG: 3'-5' exonuclease [Gammaproteobacteria bacterium]|nr:3'-5' exonuclease [Gammaproteobacteria bacterium]
MRNDELAIIDLETTGTNPHLHDVLSLAVVPFDNAEPLQLHVQCQGGKWSPFAEKNFEKFSEQWRQQAVAPAEACQHLEDYLRDTFQDSQVTIVGHNIGFDVAFLRRLAYLGGREDICGFSHRTVDTHTMLFVLNQLDIIPASALGSDGAFEYFDITVPEDDRHTALGDARATRDLYAALMEIFSNLKEGKQYRGLAL